MKTNRFFNVTAGVASIFAFVLGGAAFAGDREVMQCEFEKTDKKSTLECEAELDFGSGVQTQGASAVALNLNEGFSVECNDEHLVWDGAFGLASAFVGDFQDLRGYGSTVISTIVDDAATYPAIRFNQYFFQHEDVETRAVLQLSRWEEVRGRCWIEGIELN